MNRRPPLAEDMKGLRRLVKEGKLFAAQKWITDGKRTFDPDSAWSSPLEIAVDTGFHSMVELLLRQGADQEQRDYMLARAVADRNFELMKLLVEFGAAPPQRQLHVRMQNRTPLHHQVLRGPRHKR